MSALRPDLAIIARHIEPGARVLDIGCGSGDLMATLRAEKQVDARGLEIDAAMVSAAVGRGLPVVQGDAGHDLANYPSGSFGYAVLSQALQTMDRPADVLEQLLRIGGKAFVSFPNFAHWRVRANLALRGRMPVNHALPESWHETPNIHHLTIADFRSLAGERKMRIEGSWYLTGGEQRADRLANLLAEQAVFLLSR
tara:strand:- start:1237 stop:1827 length:591 start_codon:yes stop_codon:yes gene_type:complete